MAKESKEEALAGKIVDSYIDKDGQKFVVIKTFLGNIHLPLSDSQLDEISEAIDENEAQQARVAMKN